MNIFGRMQKKYRTYLAYGVILLVGGTIGFFLGRQPAVSRPASAPIRENTTAYRFIKPLLATGSDTTQPSAQYQGLYEKVGQYIKDNTLSGEYASVYFNDLNRGGRFVINEPQTYAPASLLKVVIMIAYLKKAEQTTGILESELSYQTSLEKKLESVPFEAPTTLKNGGTYTVGGLIEKMIIDSDNGAMNLLYANIDDAYLSKVYSDLGLLGPTSTAPYTISVKSYSLFFRVLYNATYLSDAMSEKALSILARADFPQGLVALLPKDLVVANKFGEHVDGTAGNISDVELHDCGIVYVPQNPYFICIMTHGKTLDTAQQLVQGISLIVYKNYAGSN